MEQIFGQKCEVCDVTVQLMRSTNTLCADALVELVVTANAEDRRIHRHIFRIEDPELGLHIQQWLRELEVELDSVSFPTDVCHTLVAASLANRIRALRSEGAEGEHPSPTGSLLSPVPEGWQPEWDRISNQELWYRVFWGLDDTVLIRAIWRSNHPPAEIAVMEPRELAAIRLVGSGKRLESLLEARKLHTALPPRALEILSHILDSKPPRKE